LVRQSRPELGKLAGGLDFSIADTPLLVAHGLADDRVHPEQSIQLHQFLKMNETPTGLVLYPREPHGLTERAHQLDFMGRVLKWFEKFVKSP
jgi:dipeptidyl aminopeptidase/acylaminoacyl peptidase